MRRAVSTIEPPREIGPAQNGLLGALDEDTFRTIARDLTPVSLELGAVLQAHLSPPRAVLFPCGGICSVVTLLPDGAMLEVAMVGREGFVGVEASVDDAMTLGQVMVQIPTPHAWRMSADAFRKNLQRHASFRLVITRATLVYFGTVMQITACNSLHTVEQRLSRWLLMTQDRIGDDTLQLTHDQLSMMLGVRRPTVSNAAAMLQKSGAIAYHHGRIRVLDRDKVEAVTCQCYRAVRDLSTRLLELPAQAR
jgi:CRP-like cAMP-binding protein